MSIFSICKHTIQESFESGYRKSTDNVTEIQVVITPRSRQNKRNRAFGMLVAETSVKELQVCCFRVVVHNLDPMIVAAILEN